MFGTSHVLLVWLVLFAAILGWLLGSWSRLPFTGVPAPRIATVMVDHDALRGPQRSCERKRSRSGSEVVYWGRGVRVGPE